MTRRTLSFSPQRGVVAPTPKHASLKGMIHMSPAATEYMTSIGKLYIEHGCQNHKVWNFDTGKSGAPYDELYGIGMLKMMGTKGSPWTLTDKGQQWVMANCQE